MSPSTARQSIRSIDERGGRRDITYIPVRNGFLYPVAILDWAMRKVVSWRLSNTRDASFCVEALKAAIAKYGKLEIMNVEQGSQ